MATKATIKFDYSDSTASVAIITVATGIGVFIGVHKRKGIGYILGYGLLFALGGVATSILYNNLTSKTV